MFGPPFAWGDSSLEGKNPLVSNPPISLISTYEKGQGALFCPLSVTSLSSISTNTYTCPIC